MDVRVQVRRGTTSQWNEIDPILLPGEQGIDTTLNIIKVGNGISRWSDLPGFIDQQAIAALIASLGGGSFDPRIGIMTDLTTEVKETVVEAINEINTPSVPFTALYTNAKAG